VVDGGGARGGGGGRGGGDAGVSVRAPLAARGVAQQPARGGVGALAGGDGQRRRGGLRGDVLDAAAARPVSRVRRRAGRVGPDLAVAARPRGGGGGVAGAPEQPGDPRRAGAAGLGGVTPTARS